MRYILVDRRRVDDARKCIAKMVVDDVEVEIAEGKEPTEAQFEVLLEADAVYCISLRKGFRKALSRKGVALIAFETLEAATAEIERSSAPEKPHVMPSIALAGFNDGSGRILFAELWNTDADLISERRWRFIMDSVSALVDYARDPSVANQGLDNYFGARKLNYATSGPVEVAYRVVDLNGGVLVSNVTKWHLKKGDKTSAEDAPRIYFHTERVNEELYVIMLRVGPHPSGSFSVDVPFGG